MSKETLAPRHTGNKSLSPKLLLTDSSKTGLEFIESSLKQEYKTPFTPNNVVNLFVIYELNRWLKDCLFGNVKITKNTDPDKYSYSGYEIGSNSCSIFSIPNIHCGKNAIIFGVDVSSSVHIDNENKDILILHKGPTQGLDNTTLTAEAEYYINFQDHKENFSFSLDYNGSNSF